MANSWWRPGAAAAACGFGSTGFGHRCAHSHDNTSSHYILHGAAGRIEEVGVRGLREGRGGPGRIDAVPPGHPGRRLVVAPPGPLLRRSRKVNLYLSLREHHGSRCRDPRPRLHHGSTAQSALRRTRWERTSAFAATTRDGLADLGRADDAGHIEPVDDDPGPDDDRARWPPGRRRRHGRRGRCGGPGRGRRRHGTSLPYRGGRGRARPPRRARPWISRPRPARRWR